MIDSIISSLSCELCGAPLRLDIEATMGFYSNYILIDNDIVKSVDEIMVKPLVYRCSSCNKVYKSTYKEIDKKVRKVLTEKIIIYAAKDILSRISVNNCKYLIYCGKCSGYDGSGCCPEEIYNKCEIKRFPIYEL